MNSDKLERVQISNTLSSLFPVLVMKAGSYCLQFFKGENWGCFSRSAFLGFLFCETCFSNVLLAT